MLNNKISGSVFPGGMAVLGLIAGVATMANAQTSTTPAPVTPAVTTSTTSTVTSPVDTPEGANDPADSATSTETHKHAPLGGDGVVASVTGTTVVVKEESDEGAGSYTVDASKATVTNGGVAATLADVKVGEEVFVEGTVNGTNVAATTISVGHKGGHKDAADANEAPGTETADDAGTTGN